MDWLKAIYGVVGAEYPVLSLIGAALVGGVLFGGAWWLVGREYVKDHPPLNQLQPARSDSTTPTTPPGGRPMEQSQPAPVGNALPPTAPQVRMAPEPETPVPGSEAPPTQVIVNSPGAIQAGRDVVLSGDAQLIRSIELRLSVETATPSTTPSEEHFDWGLGSVAAMFTKDKRRFRVASDLRVYDQQLSQTRRRLRFVYVPEAPTELLGQPIALLGDIDVLAVNLADIFQKEKFDTSLGATVVEWGVVLNGIPVARVQVEIPPGHMNRGQANMSVASAFAQIPAAYRAATERRP